MGTDMSIQVEGFRAKWGPVDRAPYDDEGRLDLDPTRRDYTLFGAIAGVRGTSHIKPMFPDRALPEGCGAAWKGVWFTWATWATLAEFQAADWDLAGPGRLQDTSFYRWIFGETLAELAAAYGGPENIRILLGFD